MPRQGYKLFFTSTGTSTWGSKVQQLLLIIIILWLLLLLFFWLLLRRRWWRWKWQKGQASTSPSGASPCAPKEGTDCSGKAGTNKEKERQEGIATRDEGNAPGQASPQDHQALSQRLGLWAPAEPNQEAPATSQLHLHKHGPECQPGPLRATQPRCLQPEWSCETVSEQHGSWAISRPPFPFLQQASTG